MNIFKSFILLLLIATGCTGVKYLADQEQFYKGSKIVINDQGNSDNEKQLLTKLYGVIETKPNETILGMRPVVTIYGAMGSPKRKKGLRSIIKKRFGKPPVIFKDKDVEETRKIIDNRLFNLGYFNRKVIARLEVNKKAVFATYEIDLNKPFILNKIILNVDSTTLGRSIVEAKNQSLLSKGDQYDLDQLKQERERINLVIKNKGFYHFNSQFILFKADTTAGNHKINLTLVLKNDLPSNSRVSYRLDSVSVFPNYRIENDSTIRKSEVLSLKGVSFQDPSNKFRASIFDPLIKTRSGELYQLSNHNLTLKRLSELNAFKFINLRFQSDQDSLLNTLIYLTPLTAQSIKLEAEAASKSNNFVGPGLSLELRNRNRWGGAEVFRTSIFGGFETQINGKGRPVNSFEFGLKLGVTIPKLISPVDFNISPESEIPKTNGNLGFSVLERANFYRLNKTDATFGYEWHSNKRTFHRLNLIDLSYIFLNKTTVEFENLLNSNPSLAQSFQNQFNIGGNYSLTLSNQVTQNDQNYYYFNAKLDLSGNLTDLVNGVFTDKNADGKRELFGQSYAQYVRSDVDFRYFFNFNDKHTIASRLILGVGIPYGNSEQLPYIKQFFIGGSNSIRAFPARGIGPGSYQSQNDSTLFIDQSGDIKLEANLEYRAKIYGVFKGAIFLDAGNVWLLNEDINRPGGHFRMDQIYQQLGVGTGAGLRLDFSYFVLRFDWAFPIKKPFIVENNGWVIDDINFKSRSWRRDNLILNVALGYSF